jgi:hypothetical protein
MDNDEQRSPKRRDIMDLSPVLLERPFSIRSLFRKREHRPDRSVARRKASKCQITSVVVVAHGLLRLTFADGLSGEVYVLDRMRGSVFDEARTKEGFAQAQLDEETGTVTWPGGSDLPPDTLYERVRSRSWPEARTAA